MAAPSYSTDLINVTTAETNTDWSEMSGRTGGGAATQEADYYIQGSYCVSQSVNNKTGTQVGLEYDYGSDITAFTDNTDCFFFWQVVLAGNAMDTFANGGLRLCVGSSSGNVSCWISGGNDYGRNPYGGWQNIAIDPTYTADYTDGTPTASNYRIFASYPNMVGGVSKGNMHAVDAIRYGRGQVQITDGDLGNGYGTFAGASTQNDSSSNRWGLFQAEGTGYLWKGLLSFGIVITSCDFRDSNVNITVDSTPRAYATFNKIEITHASSRVDWDGVNITALDAAQLSPGDFEVVTATADVNFDGCTFTDMNTFIFGSGSTVNTTTFRRCAQVTQGGGVFDGCSFTESDAAVSLYVSNLDNIDNCNFTSDGSNHAIELTTAHAGNSYTLAGCTYTSYAGTDGDTGNECIYNNSAGAVTINVSGGGTPTIRNGTSASTTVVTSVDVTITILDQSGNAIPGAEVAIFQDNTARTVVQASTATDENGQLATSAALNLGAVIIRVRQSTTIATFNTSATGVDGTGEDITTDSNHNFRDGDAVVYSMDGGVADVGLTDDTTYYVNNIDGTTNLSLHTTAAASIADTSRVPLNTSGTETHQLDPVRYVANSATGTIGSTAFSAQITMVTDNIATG